MKDISDKRTAQLSISICRKMLTLSCLTLLFQLITSLITENCLYQKIVGVDLAKHMWYFWFQCMPQCICCQCLCLQVWMESINLFNQLINFTTFCFPFLTEIKNKYVFTEITKARLFVKTSREKKCMLFVCICWFSISLSPGSNSWIIRAASWQRKLRINPG